MNQILSSDQHDLGLFNENDSEIRFTRLAARAVLRNDKNQVAVMYFAKTGSRKLPGGGIDEGESVEVALRREIREETGYEITDVKELGVVDEDRYYCGMHQTSYCFTATVQKFVGTELTEEETEKGMTLEWVDSIDQAISAINNSVTADDDGNEIGHTMMKLRDTAILGAAKV